MYTRSLPLLLFQFLLLSLFAQNQGQHRITLDPSMRPFYHGVESGDPMPDKVIIWTRVTPDSGTVGDIEVYWQIATDTSFTNIVNYGKAVATEDNHYCVKADVCGLQPSTYYYYMFQSGGRNSIMGRTKTAPASTADADSVRLAVVSCASWEHGYFNAYESVSNRNDVDAVVHLGDYIYEYATGDFSGNVSGRTYEPPTEAITEVGYELRYSQYKLDKQLQRIHQLYPFITVWDDHETANDAWREGAQNHTLGTEGAYDVRKHNSTSTYFKWMPIRKPDPLDTIRIFRKLRYGKLLDLIMLDTRLYDRDEQDLGAKDDTGRHMMGPVERAWFLTQLSDTSTRWKIIGNQVMFSPLEVFGQPVNADQWDGYNYERGLIQSHIMNNNIKDIVVLTGDIHTSWCMDVPGQNYDPNTGANSICVEFVGSSVTSMNSPLPIGANIIQSLNQHVKYVNTASKGYYVLDVKKGKAQADYTYMSTVTSLGASDQTGPSFFVNDNERFLRTTTPITNAPKIGAPLPPLAAKQNIGVFKIVDHYETINEGQQLIVNVIPSVSVCPALSLSIIQGNHGGALALNGADVTYVPQNNFGGYDTVGLIVCTNEVPAVCDTVYLFVEILAVQDIDTITVNVDADSTYSGCFTFDDLTYAPVAVNYTTPAHGSVTVNDTCTTFLPDTNYRGFDWVIFTACDTAGNCDTVVFKFKIDHPVVADVVELTLNKNTNITHCAVFDDLVCQPASFTVIKSTAHGTYQASAGLCLKYFPHFNYVGNDTIRIVGCDTCGLNYCDTITLVYHVQEPNALEETNHFIVFGMFPNPVNDKLVVQYYLYESSQVEFSVFDITGKLISQDEVYHPNTGLQYAQLNTLALPVGNYVVEVKAAGHIYRKKVIKE